MKSEDTRALIAYRLEQAQAALTDARTLIDAHGSTASVVNRSYYAAFYAGLALLLTLGKSSSRHAGVIAILHQEFFRQNIIPREYGKIINRLFELRQKSDYQVTAPVDPMEAEEVWTQACDFVRIVKKYLSEQKFSGTNCTDGHE